MRAHQLALSRKALSAGIVAPHGVGQGEQCARVPRFHPRKDRRDVVGVRAESENESEAPARRFAGKVPAIGRELAATVAVEARDPP